MITPVTVSTTATVTLTHASDFFVEIMKYLSGTSLSLWLPVASSLLSVASFVVSLLALRFSHYSWERDGPIGRLYVSGIFEADTGKDCVALKLINDGRMKLYTGAPFLRTVPDKHNESTFINLNETPPFPKPGIQREVQPGEIISGLIPVEKIQNVCAHLRISPADLEFVVPVNGREVTTPLPRDVIELIGSGRTD